MPREESPWKARGRREGSKPNPAGEKHRRAPHQAADVRSAVSRMTKDRISSSLLPAIRAALMASTSYSGHPTDRPPMGTGLVKSPSLMST